MLIIVHVTCMELKFSFYIMLLTTEVNELNSNLSTLEFFWNVKLNMSIDIDGTKQCNNIFPIVVSL